MRPSYEAGCVDDGGDLGWRQSEIFFAKGLDSKIPSWPVGQINDPTGRQPTTLPARYRASDTKMWQANNRIEKSAEISAAAQRFVPPPVTTIKSGFLEPKPDFKFAPKSLVLQFG
jgi:hypothetical protein